MNIKAIRKSIREAVKPMKAGMFGKNSCVDVGGRKWCLEYGVVYWCDGPQGYWDEYGASGTQRDMVKDLIEFNSKSPEVKTCVVIRLMCGNKVNEEKMFDLDGNEVKNN